MSFPKYLEYKDSGIEWLGEVPAHWTVSKLKHLARIRNGRDYKAVEVDDGGYPVIGSGGEFARASDYLYKGESVLLGRKGTIDKPLYVDGAFWTVDTMFYTEIGEDVHGRFLYYYARCFRYDQYSTNTALPSMAQEDLANIHLAVPCCAEQATIAAFLDHETARIDALVEEQKRLIALLKEKRQAVISHAVTKGLDPDVPMKDSGVEWLGEVPAHWEVRKLSSVTDKITNGYVGPTRGLFVEDGIPYLQSLHIKNNEIKFTPEYFVTKEWSDNHAKSILKSGDVLVVQTGDIGQVAVVPEGFPEANCHALIIVSSIKGLLTGDWLAWVLESDYGYNSLLSIKTGALHPHLNCGYVKDVYIPVPPLDEQVSIISYVKDQQDKFLGLIAEAESMVGHLIERRSALISAAVTGKIDVRGWTPPADSAPAQQQARMEAV